MRGCRINTQRVSFMYLNPHFWGEQDTQIPPQPIISPYRRLPVQAQVLQISSFMQSNQLKTYTEVERLNWHLLVMLVWLQVYSS